MPIQGQVMYFSISSSSTRRVGRSGAGQGAVRDRRERSRAQIRGQHKYGDRLNLSLYFVPVFGVPAARRRSWRPWQPNWNVPSRRSGEDENRNRRGRALFSSLSSIHEIPIISSLSPNYPWASRCWYSSRSLSKKNTAPPGYRHEGGDAGNQEQQLWRNAA